MKLKLSVTVALVLFSFFCFGQLQPGFDAKEYLSALSITFGKQDSMIKHHSALLSHTYKRAYRSQVVGLDNRWDLWVSNDNTQALISIRGTVASKASWLANIYSAMQPATGSIKINDSTDFHYKLADYPNAAVHTGWLISLGALAGDIEQKIKEQYQKGIKNFILTGHSQGGAITYLLRSYLYYRTQSGALPADITYKTYCSAAPKPGNLYYAYDFDYINRSGWAFTVVNAADWVPETPVSIQQLSDLNTLNPFSNVKGALKNQKFVVRLYAGLVYNKLNRSTKKAQRRYQKYLGQKMKKEVKKVLPQLAQPGFANTLNYMRAGTPIILMPDAAYYQQFPNDPNKWLGIWNHHTFQAYSLLLQKCYVLPAAESDNGVTGTSN